MASDPDPYTVLGLARGASLDDVKRAYRRLAKANHPDAAGERSIPRFLAIQAAYEQLEAQLDPTARPRQVGSRPPTPRRPWEADPARSDSTRRAYGGRGRTSRGGTTGRSGARPGARPGTTPPGTPPGTPPPGTAGPATGGTSAGTTDGGHSKATPGSTSYDGADATPFEPDWGGASWYGTTSGTYWTLNPKEYADPRKHGPEYQARARRATRGRRPAVDDDRTQTDAGSESGPDETQAASHTTSSWWESTAGPGPAGPRPTENGPTGDAGPSVGSPPGPPRGKAGDEGRTVGVEGGRASAPEVDLSRAVNDVGRALTDERVGGLRGRLVRALVGWLPIALGIGWIIGEASGCSRFAATCDPSTGLGSLALQLTALVLLVLVPALASMAATAAVTVSAVALVAVLILSVDAGPLDDARRTTLGLLLVVGWLVGVAIAIAQRRRPGTARPGPVS